MTRAEKIQLLERKCRDMYMPLDNVTYADMLVAAAAFAQPGEADVLILLMSQWSMKYDNLTQQSDEMLDSIIAFVTRPLRINKYDYRQATRAAEELIRVLQKIDNEANWPDE